MADRPQQLLDTYAGRSAGDDAGNSIGTIGEIATAAVGALRAVLDVVDEMDQHDLFAAYAFRLRTTITTALEAS